MITIPDELDRAIKQLLGRSSGPLHFRLLLQPIVAGILAIKAGIRDARTGRPPFLLTILKDSNQRGALIRSGWTDIGKLFIIAFLIDTAYQLFVLHAFYPLQSLIVAIAVAVVPYASVRGIAMRLARRQFKSKAPPTSRAA